MELATFAGGCFWCTEAVFCRLKGVVRVLPGYIGGTVAQPTYEQVSTGSTGHAEAVQLTFNPSIISYETLLQVFFATHDPTTVNKQGHDSGTQYRSEIFYHSQQQQLAAEKMITRLNQSTFSGKIVTRVSPAIQFYPAENYHQRYYQKNSYQPYCQIVIDPKLQKLQQKFRQLLN